MSTTAVARSRGISTAVLLKISGLSLVLPQADIRGLESAADIDAGEAEPYSVGWIKYAQQRWPVYCLSPELSLLADVPVARRACALLSTGAGYVGILCDGVSIGKQTELWQRYELPSAMHIADTPILGLISLDEGNIACETNAQLLAAHVARRVNHAD